MNPKIPQTDAEADALRAYIPTETLLALAKIRDEEIRESDRRRIEYEENRAIYEAAKAAEKKARDAAKRAKAKADEYFRRPLFPRLDAAKEIAWVCAAQAREAAIAAGEPLRLETCAQVSARQQAAQLETTYTP